MLLSKLPEDLHPTVKRGCIEFIKRMAGKGYNVGISATYRDNEYQDKIYAQGRTTAGSIVTNAKGGESIHNYRYAFDIFKNVKGEAFSDLIFFKTAGKTWEEMGGVWGGSWTGFVDTPHFEFTQGKEWKDCKNGWKMPLDTKMKWETSKK